MNRTTVIALPVVFVLFFHSVGTTWAQTVAPFGPRTSRVAIEPRVARQAPPSLIAADVDVAPEQVPVYDLNARVAVTHDDGLISPVGALGYTDLRSEDHPWWTEIGYRSVDVESGDRLDNLFGSINYQLLRRARGKLQVEVDHNIVPDDMTRTDAYLDAQMSPFNTLPLSVDILAGVSSAKPDDGERAQAFMAGILPAWQFTDSVGLYVLYALSNEIDEDDYYEIGLPVSVPRVRGALTFVGHKGGAVSVRFQTTLKRVMRPAS